MNTRLTVNVRSFDFDGCFFNAEYLARCIPNTVDYKQVLKANEKFLGSLKQSILEETPDFVELMINSSRQSLRIDVINDQLEDGTRKGSCFPAMNVVVNYLQEEIPQCHFDTYLLSDTYGELKAGTSFDKAIQAREQFEIDNSLPQLLEDIAHCENDEKLELPEKLKEHANWAFDDFKISLVYGQMHHIASNPKYKNAKIVFDFYDDRDDILAALKLFYQNNPKLRPKNLTLRLNKCDGNGSVLYDVLESTHEGFTDEKYETTLREFAKTTSYDGKINLDLIGKKQLIDGEAFLKIRQAHNPSHKKVTFAVDQKVNQNQAMADFYSSVTSTVLTTSVDVEEKMAVEPSSGTDSDSGMLATGSSSFLNSVNSSSALLDVNEEGEDEEKNMTKTANSRDDDWYRRMDDAITLQYSHLSTGDSLNDVLIQEDNLDDLPDLNTPNAQFIRAREKLVTSFRAIPSSNMMKTAALDVLTAVDSVKNPTIPQYEMLTRVLNQTSASVENPLDTKQFTQLGNLVNDLSKTNKTWTRIVGGAVVAFLGVVCIVAAIGVAVMTKGFAVPLSIKGIEFGVGLIAAAIGFSTAIAGICASRIAVGYLYEGLHNRSLATATAGFWKANQDCRGALPESKSDVSPVIDSNTIQSPSLIKANG